MLLHYHSKPPTNYVYSNHPPVKPHYKRRQVMQHHFNHIVNNTPKHVVDLHEIKKKQEAKPNVVTPNHVLFEFNKVAFVNPLEMKTQIESSLNLPLEKDNVVEYVVDDYIDMGNIYISEFEKPEYNPMYFSLRHYISSK